MNQKSHNLKNLPEPAFAGTGDSSLGTVFYSLLLREL